MALLTHNTMCSVVMFAFLLREISSEEKHCAACLTDLYFLIIYALTFFVKYLSLVKRKLTNSKLVLAVILGQNKG